MEGFNHILIAFDGSDSSVSALKTAELIKLFKDQYGRHSLDDFGQASYKGSLTSIMIDYWRSFHAIKYLVEERANHNVHLVFEEYHRWYEEGRKQPLTEFFGIENLFR